MVNPVRSGQLPSFSELFVNAAAGNDAAAGSAAHPYKTITRALQQLPTGMITLRLSPGTYSTASGETFPIVVPDRVSIAGSATGQGQTVVIRGGGEYASPTFGPQSIALWLGDTTLLNGLTVTNPTAKGTGIWIESVATIANCRILNCGREGIFATDRASLAVVDCLLQGNRASGISLVRHAKGQIRRSLLQDNSFGLVVSDYAAPLLIDSQFVENRTGIVLSGTARPVLRNNRIERNQQDGLAVLHQASPDLGQPQDPAGNFFGANGACDLRNATSIALISVGNDLVPWRVEGAMTFAASQIKHPSNTQTLRHSAKQTKLKPVLTPTAYPLLSTAAAPLPDLVGHWAELFVYGLLAEWTVNSFLNRAFEPDQPISRAEYTTWVIKTFDLPARRSPPAFADVPADYWAATAITQAQRMGFITAFADRTFRPEVPLTRLQAIVSLVNGLGLGDGNPDVVQVYRDRAQIPSWSVGAVASATQQRLIVSQIYPDRLRSMERITRAELAAMLYQGLVSLGQAAAMASPHIVNPVAVAALNDIVADGATDGVNHWAAELVRGLLSQGRIGQAMESKFSLDRIMTRAEYATWLVRVFRPTRTRPPKVFADVAEDPAKLAIDQVYRARLMGGFADDTFRPQQPVTRVQVLLALVSQLQCPAVDLAILDRFADANTIPQSARQAIAAATAQWLVVNFPQLTQLQPNRAATWAEVVAMMYQALVRLGQANATPSPYIIDPRYPNQHQVFRAAPIVVLDPGHGGADLGAVATSGSEPSPEVPGLLPVAAAIRLQEKDIVLSIAHQTASLLQQQGIQVLLTRSSDQHIDLTSRAHLAEQVAADLFVSLHTNATTPAQPEVNGLETYYYPDAAENQQFAQTLHAAILQSLNISDRHLHPTQFYLLRSVSMPAAHLELGYLTGNADAPNLANPEYCKQMAAAIVKGVLQYVRVER